MPTNTRLGVQDRTDPQGGQGGGARREQLSRPHRRVQASLSKCGRGSVTGRLRAKCSEHNGWQTGTERALEPLAVGPGDGTAHKARCTFVRAHTQRERLGAGSGRAPSGRGRREGGQGVLLGGGGAAWKLEETAALSGMECWEGTPAGAGLSVTQGWHTGGCGRKRADQREAVREARARGPCPCPDSREVVGGYEAQRGEDCKGW